MIIRIGILTISDRCSQGLMHDDSGLSLQSMVKQKGWETARYKVVSDDEAKIQHILIEWCEEKSISVVLTTGGTGLGPRDVTPEATKKVLEKEIPGLEELIRIEGLKTTPASVLSRGICGLRKRTLIINLPGSPRGAVDSLKAVAHLIPHALEILQGTNHENSQKLT